VNISENLSPDELKNQIRNLIELKEPVIFTTYTFPHSMELYLEQVLAAFLEITEQEALTNYVTYFVKELIGNAKKANTKRIYFYEKGLDINSIDDYREGMKTFKAEMQENKEHLLALQEEKGLYIQIKFWKKNKTIIIEVSNNTQITALEEKRMINKIKMGKQYQSLEDAMNEVIDDVEGSGLGLIILVLMMKKMGLKKKLIKIQKGEKVTNIGVELPVM